MKKILILLFMAYSAQGFLIAQENISTPEQASPQSLGINTDDDMDSLFVDDAQETIHSNFSEIKAIQQPKKNGITLASVIGICKAYLNPLYQRLHRRFVYALCSAKKAYLTRFPQKVSSQKTPKEII